MTLSLLRALAEEERKIERLRSLCFPQQLAFIDDPARLKAAFCSRRAGKTMADAIYLLDTAVTHPGTLSLFACITRDRAKSIMWDGRTGLKAVADMAKLGLSSKHYDETSLTVWLDNGSRIRLFGADSTTQQMEKVLGDAFGLVIFDECASFRSNLKRLVYSKVKPAAADLGATIALTGTPGDFIGPPEDRHLFYAVTTGLEPGWSVHSWNTMDNPHMRVQWQRELDEIERRDPLYKLSADFKIMYLAEWAIDATKIVYRYTNDNLIEHAPDDLTSFAIGVDLGWEDATAFVVVGWREHDRTLYVLRAFKRKGINLEEVADEVNALRGTYRDAWVVVDNAAKQSVETMRAKYDIPFHAAEKAGKADFIGVMNTDLVCQRVKLVRTDTGPLMAEWDTLIWDERAATKKELSSCENHCADAALYAWRFSRAYMAEPRVEDAPRTPDAAVREFWKRERERMVGADEDGMMWAD